MYITRYKLGVYFGMPHPISINFLSFFFFIYIVYGCVLKYFCMHIKIDRRIIVMVRPRIKFYNFFSLLPFPPFSSENNLYDKAQFIRKKNNIKYILIVKYMCKVICLFSKPQSVYILYNTRILLHLHIYSYNN